MRISPIDTVHHTTECTIFLLNHDIMLRWERIAPDTHAHGRRSDWSSDLSKDSEGLRLKGPAVGREKRRVITDKCFMLDQLSQMLQLTQIFDTNIQDNTLNFWEEIWNTSMATIKWGFPGTPDYLLLSPVCWLFTEFVKGFVRRAVLSMLWSADNRIYTFVQHSNAMAL